VSVDYGTDVQALDDLNDPEILVSGDLNLAYALARRLMTPAGAMAEIGDSAPYDSIDIRDWFGKRFALVDRTAIDDLQQQCRQVLAQDARVQGGSVDVVATFNAGTLTVSVQGLGGSGPFAFVLQTSGVTAALLRSA
jgi:hypothetical protein